MNQIILGLISALVLVGCQSVPTKQYENLPFTAAALLSKQWEQLERFPPLYPVEEALTGNEGCVTVEYIIAPNYEIKDIKVLTASSKHFAKQAKRNVAKWHWSALPQGLLQQAIKTATHYQFCLETGDGHCAIKNAFENSQCRGEDTIYVVGTRITHPR